MATTPQTRRRRYAPEEIDHWLGEQNREGLTYRELGRRSGIPIPTLAGWRRKARLEGAESSELVELHVRNGQARLSLDALDARPPVIVVVLANGRRITVEGGFEDAALVARLATMLEAPC